jgi:hypothetical protein
MGLDMPIVNLFLNPRKLIIHSIHSRILQRVLKAVKWHILVISSKDLIYFP